MPPEHVSSLMYAQPPLSATQAVPFHPIFRAPEESFETIVADVNHFSVQNFVALAVSFLT